MLLMFGVGLHFSLGDLMSVRRIAVPGAVVQMGIATVLGTALASWWGWGTGAALVFGLSLSCASTVVLLKALDARGLLDTMNGRIAVGWLVVEDLATVLMLVLMPPLATLLAGTAAPADGVPLWRTVAVTLLEVAAFVALMLVVGRRLLPWLLWQVAQTGSRELFTLGVIAAAIGIAVLAAYQFSVSYALGAFFAGMVMRESQFSQRAASESLPLRDAFSVLFFVAVGMLFDPAVVVEMPFHVLGVVAIIVVGKTLAAMALVLALRYPLNTGLTVAASLAQIGEFSFILAGLGLSLGLLPQEGMSLVLAGALISIALNPLVFAGIEPARAWILRRSAAARRLEPAHDHGAPVPRRPGRAGRLRAGRATDRAVARRTGHRIRRRGAEPRAGRGPPQGGHRRGIRGRLRARRPDPGAHRAGRHAGGGDARPGGRAADGRDRARPQPGHRGGAANPQRGRVRAAAPGRLRRDGMGTVVFGEEELAKGMLGHVLNRFERQGGAIAPQSR